MSALTDSFLADAKSSVLGTAKKALLILHKDDSQRGDDAMTPQKISAATMDALYPTGQTARSTLTGISEALGADFHVLQVQYNPASVEFQASSEEVTIPYLQQNIDPSIPNQNTRPPSVTLSVHLIFDAMNVRDSFMFEKFRVTTQDVAQLAAKRTLKKDIYSVQAQTNGLIGMIMRKSTRLVTFQWAEMSFTGEVTEIQADYSMFSVSGRPVRSQVKINISQRVDSNSDSKYWNQAFDKCFGNQNISVVSGGKSQMEGLSNLLNIGI